MDKSNNLIAAILVFFVALFLYTKFLGPIPFSVNSVQTTKTNLFQVTGDGKVTAIPNTAQLSFGVTKQAVTVTDAQNQTNTAIKNILDAVKSQGIDEKDITTTDYSVNPNYDFSSGRQNITGYTVSQNIEVKIQPVDKANKVLDAAVSQGANVVGGISFTFDDKTKQDLEDQARKMAIDAAKKKAESLSGASGLRLGKIIDVEENASFPTPIRMDTGAKLLQAAPQTQPSELPTGESSVTSTITLTYETL